MTLFVILTLWVAPISLTGAHHAQVCRAMHNARYCAAHEVGVRQVR